jgi:hypothetical protein
LPGTGFRAGIQSAVGAPAAPEIVTIDASMAELGLAPVDTLLHVAAFVYIVESRVVAVR